MDIIKYDFEKILENLTGKENWLELNGPDSGCGVDYWYKSGTAEAYINIDQSHCTISVDEEVIFSGELSEIENS